MNLLILSIVIGFLLSLFVFINERKNLLSIVGVINIIFFMGYVLRPLLIIYFFDSYTYSGTDILNDPSSAFITILIANYFYIFFIFGAVTANNKFEIDYVVLNDKSAVRVSVILMILGSISYLYYLKSAGALSGGAISLFEYLYSARGFYYFRAFSFLFIFGLFGYLYLKKTNIFLKIGLVLFAILISVSFYARQHLIIFIILGFHLYSNYNYNGKNILYTFRKSIASVLILLLVVYAMVLMLSMRSSISNGDEINIVQTENNQVQLLDYFLNSGQLTFLDFGIDVMHNKSYVENMTGHSLMNLLLIPVPTSLFPSKPENFNRALAKNIPGITQPSPAFGFNSEIYFNFPYIFLFVGPVVMFFVGRGLQRSFLSLGKNYFYFMLYIFLYSSFFMFIRSGTFASIGVFIERILPFLLIVILQKLIFWRKQKF